MIEIENKHKIRWVLEMYFTKELITISSFFDVDNLFLENWENELFDGIYFNLLLINERIKN